MLAFLLYILKSTCCLTLFYVAYKVILSKETFFGFNRVVFGLGVLLSAAIPFVKLNFNLFAGIYHPVKEFRKLIEVNQLGSGGGLASGQEALLPETTGFLSVPGIITGLYCLGFLGVFFYFFLSYLSLWQLIRKGDKIQAGDCTVVLLQRDIAPFNWGKYIVLSVGDYENHAREILAHELAHYKKRHIYDLFLIDGMLLFHWFNPVAWLLKRELKNLHEYQADEKVLQQGIDAVKYQLLIVEKAINSPSYVLANNFTQSKLKKRIAMMLQEKSDKQTRWKIIYFFPVLIGAFCLFSSPVKQDNTPAVLNESIVFEEETGDRNVELYAGKEDNKRIQSLLVFERKGKKEFVTVYDTDKTEDVQWKIANLRQKSQIHEISIYANKNVAMGYVSGLRDICRSVLAGAINYTKFSYLTFEDNF